jgi:hypothetical protein
MRGAYFIRAAVLAWTSAVAAADQPPICADRPGKATPTCTVPARMVQIETGLVDWTRDRSDGVTSDALSFGSTAFKYGLSDRWHMEVGVTPYSRLRVRGFGARETDSGFGDLFVRSKYRLTSGDGVQLALLPGVKIPTANHRIGNGKWEAGLVVPVDYAIANSPLGIAVAPELDWLADDDGHGHHVAMAQVISLGVQATDKLTVSGDLWAQWNWDPAGTTRQTTADAAAAYLVNDKVQLDAGANFGLNRNTPDVELYAGVSKRF